jgi:hypothetical protein
MVVIASMEIFYNSNANASGAVCFANMRA